MKAKYILKQTKTIRIPHQQTRNTVTTVLERRENDYRQKHIKCQQESTTPEEESMWLNTTVLTSLAISLGIYNIYGSKITQNSKKEELNNAKILL